MFVVLMKMEPRGISMVVFDLQIRDCLVLKVEWFGYLQSHGFKLGAWNREALYVWTLNYKVAM